MMEPYEKWAGEEVTITLRSSDDLVKGKVKAASNGALILIPTSGRRVPSLIEFDDIKEVSAISLPVDVIAWPTVETIRLHMLKFHAWNTPNAPALDLLDVHRNLHKMEDGSDGHFGHCHPAT